MLCCNVQVAGECIAIACEEGLTVLNLAEKAIEKLNKLKPGSVSNEQNECFEVRKATGGALLDPSDLVHDMLKDGEFVLVTTKCDPRDQLTADNSVLYLDGQSLTTGDLVKCGRTETQIAISMEAKARIEEARELLEQIVREEKTVYGVTTGFGNFANVRIPNDKLMELQENLIRSQACGMGPALPPPRARMLLALRINVVCKGNSGIGLQTVQKMVDAFNAFCVSWVPEQGSVGASGDLAPLAHLALGLLGEGQMWSPSTGWDDAAKVLAQNGLSPMVLGPKEGLTFINGTQLISTFGAEVRRDRRPHAGLDVLRGTTKAYDPDIHRVRPHTGQIRTADRLRALLHSSKIAESHRSCGRVQDAYTLRCVPQVHGIVHDTIEFVRGVITVELNSATDNPLVFAQRGEILSGGNFHGEYPAKVLDYLAIAIHELAQMSERRLERLVNDSLSGLPPFLAKDGGLNCGFMMVQIAAASLVSENKVLCHPSSVDSIPTCGNLEDHVSMGGWSARKALKVVENVEKVLAMELLAACQGIEFLRPLTTTTPLERVYHLVRAVSPAIERDRFMAPEVEAVIELLKEQTVWECVKPHLEAALGYPRPLDCNLGGNKSKTT